MKNGKTNRKTVYKRTKNAHGKRTGKQTIKQYFKKRTQKHTIEQYSKNGQEDRQ